MLWQRRLLIIATGSLFIVVILYSGILYMTNVFTSEVYFVPNPSIDTTFAPAYSEKRFRKVRVGMTEGEVLNLVGEPLVAKPSSGANRLWEYSRDDKFRWWDFAWLYRAIEFDKNGVVTSVESAIRYD